MATVRPCRRPEITREMATNDFRWPGLLLPLKRHVDNVMECAYLCDPAKKERDGEIWLYYGNMWAPKPEDRRVTYKNVDELIADGWEVD
jgi:hypothetical protein